MEQRQIKFRGFSKEQNKWVYGSLLQSEIAANGYCLCEIHERFADDFSIARCFVEPQSVGQWTGLRDRNGKEIYEGDVLKALPEYINIYRFKDIGEVKYVEDSGGFRIVGKWNKNQHDEPLTCDTAITSEVIGNVFENNPITEKLK
jgi:uncharacterized phage protein (TIGR01671 family)